MQQHDVAGHHHDVLGAFAVRFLRVRRGAISTDFHTPLVVTTQNFMHLPFVIDKVLEVAVVPTGRVGCPRSFESSCVGVLAFASTMFWYLFLGSCSSAISLVSKHHDVAGKHHDYSPFRHSPLCPNERRIADCRLQITGCSRPVDYTCSCDSPPPPRTSLSLSVCMCVASCICTFTPAYCTTS
jgi:hypothetical protein